MKQRIKESSPSSAIYGLGFIGAVVYYISTASSFMAGIAGIFKAIVWPAFLVYELLEFLNSQPL
ncbi:MAG: hypothetical protein HKN39_04535 [Flavobacteriales bacterium]|nr:hypothetical protein [Flavobacteriales bacterium]